MTKRILLIHPTIRPPGVDILKAGAEVSFAADGAEDTVLDALKASRADAMVVRVERATRRHFEGAPDLKIVGMHGVGTDLIDIEAATDNGVLVMNTPWVNYKSTSEHALALLMAVTKQILPGHEAVRQGRFVEYRNTQLPAEMEGKTLFVIGVGRIGGEMARKCRAAFNMRVLGIDPAYGAEELVERGAEAISFEEGLAAADYVTIHTPLNATTRKLMDARAFGLMKPGAVFINAARGGVMDQAALVAALDAGHLGGAGLDVFDPEPVAAEDAVCGHPRIVLSPHYAGDTVEARTRCSVTIAGTVLRALDGEAPEGAVNPEVLTRPNCRLRLAGVTA